MKNQPQAVKNQVQASKRIPPSAPPKKCEPEKPKKPFSSKADYSKIESKIKYTASAAATKPKNDIAQSRPTTVSSTRTYIGVQKRNIQEDRTGPEFLKCSKENWPKKDFIKQNGHPATEYVLTF